MVSFGRFSYGSLICNYGVAKLLLFDAVYLKIIQNQVVALDELQLPHPGWPQPGAAYAQRDTKASRKVVQPLLVSFFDAGHAKPNSA